QRHPATGWSAKGLLIDYRKTGSNEGRSTADLFAGAGRPGMSDKSQKIGWIGMGRMGFPMAERLLAAGYDVSIWNRTRAKAEPLASHGGKVVDRVSSLAGVGVVFSIVSTGKDLDEIYFGQDGIAAGNGKLPAIFVDCSTIAVE